MELASNIPQFFFDDSVIARQHRLVRRWQPAKIFPRPIIKPDRPWEARILALYGTVFQQRDGSYRMYYSNLPLPKGWEGEYAKVFVAESRDGFHWEKPELAITDWRGNRRNNILIAPSQTLDAPSVALDPDDEYPYKP